MVDWERMKRKENEENQRGRERWSILIYFANDVALMVRDKRHLVACFQWQSLLH